MVAFHIRPFEPDDRHSLIELWRRCDLTRGWNDPNRDIDRKLAVGDGLLLVAVVEGSLIGSVMAGYDGHRGWINYLAVDPDHQGNGLGGSLMSAAEDRLRELGCPKVNLQVRSGNVAAIDFYAALDYKPDEVVSMGKRLVFDESGPSMSR